MSLNCQMALILCQIFKIVSNIFIKKHETLTTIPPVHVYINRINNGLVFTIIVLVQCNLVDNQYQQMSEVLYTFKPNKPYAYLLNVEPSNLVFWKNYNTDFDEINITFMNQNGRPLEIEDKVNLTLLISK